ncbi:hypothetical protein CDD81_5333 [Ophiocordyceps australis]|uniref:Carboxy-cis,cis-muconate cyclase n=1 Tax=Ophiocordyceps australis TaxID=1399860 RepID=A0A2C5Y331_9HYPO|nr:hypothetical protein CDD81_5333 [Ophiocordyceps australis]
MPIHHLMVGTWTPPGYIFTVAFDDVAHSLELVKQTAIPENEPISWMAFSHDKKNIYGAALKNWNSFAVASPTEISHQTSLPLQDVRAQAPDADSRAIFLNAASVPPYAVYANPFYSFAGNGTVISVTPSGALSANDITQFELDNNSGIHGSVFDPKGRYLYSADLSANKIWVHWRSDAALPGLQLVGKVDGPAENDHPRWVAMHPSGNYLYALMESGNRICEFAINKDDHLPVFTQKSFPLVPEGTERAADYRADVVALSSSAGHLFATTRGPDENAKGFVSTFALDQNGSIQRLIATMPTDTSGGHSNAVSPADFSDEWVAIVEDVKGYLDMYRWENETLSRVARLQVDHDGFGMNAIWYD